MRSLDPMLQHEALRPVIPAAWADLTPSFKVKERRPRLAGTTDAALSVFGE